MLSQNYPNPFNPSTTISFEMPQRGEVQVSIYNSLGQLVRTLVNEQREPGSHSVVWDGRDNAGVVVSSGMYLYQVKAGEVVEAKKMILLK
jgi:flagellar hook assembly protein FlgD